MSRDKARLRDEWDDQQRRRRYDDVTTHPRRSSPPRHHPPRRRSVWPWLLIGCAGGIGILVLAAAIVVFVTIRSATGGSSILPVMGNPGTYTRQSPAQPVEISQLTAIHVHNPIGDVSISVDANATAPTVAYTKKVRAANNDDANNQFNNITVQVQPTGTPAGTLSVSASVPDTGSLLGDHNASVDLNITVPAQRTSSASGSTTATPAPTTATSTTVSTSPLTLTVDMSIGNVTTDGLSGILQVKDNIGNITVRQGTLSDGSHLQTGTGNVTFNGNIDTTPGANNTTARYKLQSETGNVDATLPADANLTLDANTNAGTITSDFPINVQSSDGSATFYGPLNPGAGTTTAVLSLNVSTGNIMLHKAT